MKRTKLLLILLACALGLPMHAQVVGDVFKVNVTNGQANFVIVKHDTSDPTKNEVHLREIYGSGTVEIPATVSPTGEIQSSETYKVTATEGWNTIVQDTRVTAVILPEGLTTINSGSFQYVDNSVNFDAIALPSTLTAIGTRCFEGSLITRFYFKNGNATYALDSRYGNTDGYGTYSPAIYTANGETLVLLAAGFGKNNTETDNVHNDGNKINRSDYEIKDGTTKIEKTAINHAVYLRKLTIPSSVTDINVGRFVGDASIISSGTYFEATGRNDRTPKQNKEAVDKYTYFTHDGVLFHYYSDGDDKGNALVAVPRKYSDVCEIADDYHIDGDITLNVRTKYYSYRDQNNQFVEIPGRTFQVTLSGHTINYKGLANQPYIKPGKDQAQARYLKNFTQHYEDIAVSRGDGNFTGEELTYILSQLVAEGGYPSDVTLDDIWGDAKYASLDVPYIGKHVFEFEVPEAVTAIASDAIIGVKYLEEIDLGPSTVTVSNYAVAQMGGLKKIDIEAHTTDIKEGAIVECSGIEQFWVASDNPMYTHDINPEAANDPHFGVLYTKDGKNLKLYPNGKVSPTTYAIYDGTEIIEKQAFKGNKYILDITIPTTVKEIHEEAFRRFGLETESSGHVVNLTFNAQGSQLELIELNAFKESYFTNVTIPSSVNTIQNNAFESMPELLTVEFLDGCVIGNAVIEDGVDFAGKPVQITKEGLGVASFRNNPKLQTITFGSTPNLTVLTNNSFSADSALISVTLPITLVEIGPNALQAAGGSFVKNNNLNNVTAINLSELSALQNIGIYAFAGSNIGNTINLNNGVLKGIGSQAFDHCMKMTDIKLPRTLWHVDDGAFTFCTALNSIDVILNEGDKGGDYVCAYISIDGMLCTSDKTTLHTFPGGKGDTDYALLPYITTVKPYAFYGCQKLTSIVFPKTIEDIGFRAMAKCKSLKSISFMGDWSDYTDNENTFYRLNDDNTFRVTSRDEDDPDTPLSKEISINVRQNWAYQWHNKYQQGVTDPDDNPLVYYANKFKEVVPSFYVKEDVAENYDRDLEFFALSENEVGVVGMKASESGQLRRSVIVKDAVQTPGDYQVIKNNIITPASRSFTVKAILDFAFANTSRLNTVIVLPEIDYIGAKAFTGAANVDRVFLAGNTTVPGFTSETLQMNGEYFKEQISNDKITGYHLKYDVEKDFYPFDNTASGKKVKIYCRKSISEAFKAYADRNETIKTWDGDVTRNHKPVVDHRVPRGTSKKFATICYPFGVQLPLDNNYRAYLPLEYLKNTDNTLTLVMARSIDDNYVPAYEGVLLHSSGGDITAFDSESDAELAKTDDESQGFFYISERLTSDPNYNQYTFNGSDNILNNIGEGKKYKKAMTGTVEHTQVTPSSSNVIYYMSSATGQFKKLTSGAEMNYFLAFLQLEGDQYQGKALKFTFDWEDDVEGNTTGIDQITGNETDKDAVYYNLQGQKVENPKQGIYIVNGKKVVLK